MSIIYFSSIFIGICVAKFTSLFYRDKKQNVDDILTVENNFQLNKNTDILNDNGCCVVKEKDKIFITFYKVIDGKNKKGKRRYISTLPINYSFKKAV